MPTGLPATPDMDSDYPYANTAAAVALSGALDSLSDQGTSLRQVAANLGYRSAVVVSHMRTGRLPIPVDRAVMIAKAVRLDPAKFLMTVLKQRYPDINFKRALATDEDHVHDSSTVTPGLARILADLEKIAGRPINELPAEHIGVLREVVGDAHPRRRWLGVSEVALIDLVRRVRPDFARDGFGDAQMDAIEKMLAAPD